MPPHVSLQCANPECSKLLMSHDPRFVVKAKKGTYDGGSTVATLCADCGAAALAPLTPRPVARARNWHGLR